MKRAIHGLRLVLACLLVASMAWAAPLRAYTVLSHAAIIDAAWKSHSQPLLLKKYPQATEDDPRRAQVYVYGGAIIQDMGNYSFGSTSKRKIFW